MLDIVKQSSRRTRALLDNAQITTVDGELVTLSAPTALAKMIGEDSNTTVLRQALTQVVGGDWKIAVAAGANGAPTPMAEDDVARDTPSAPPAATRTAPPVAEPDPRDDTDPDEPGTPVSDPETEALKLLQAELGARPVE